MLLRVDTTLPSKQLMPKRYTSSPTRSEKTAFLSHRIHTTQETRARGLTPLQITQDNHRKTVLVLDGRTTKTDDGIEIIQALDLLLE